MILKELVLAVIVLLFGARSEPQGTAYLPPSGARPPAVGPASPSPNVAHPDEWAGDPANYEFSYEVQDGVAGLDFGHREMRKDSEAAGTYHVLLPDGRTQIVDYIADNAGYRPMIRYEGTATYPAPAPALIPAPSRGSADDGYRY